MKELFREQIIEEKLDRAEIKKALMDELKGMENRKPEIRKNGKGDLKYEILYRVIAELEKREFDDIYDKLEDFEKHAIITRLENAAREGNLTYDFVEEFRRELYGFETDDEGKDIINIKRQCELEQQLQDMCK